MDESVSESPYGAVPLRFFNAGWRQAALLSVAEMRRADQIAIDDGRAGSVLMEAAGRAVAAATQALVPEGLVAVLCGPGNNGGDGWVAARLLREAGRSVAVASYGAREALRGDAASAAARWPGPVAALTPEAVDGAAVVVDALFGAGLRGPLTGAAAATAARVAALGTPVLAVDIPSGVCGDSGRVAGAAFTAAATVTFFRRKPGHLLYPGRGRCGVVTTADIGIPDRALEVIAPPRAVNDSALWRAALPRPTADSHKYARGAVLIAAGSTMPGAARLAARAAQRVGAGLVSVQCAAAIAAECRRGLDSMVVHGVRCWQRRGPVLADPRWNGFLIGPGLGRDAMARRRVREILARRAPTVLDADAMSAFAAAPGALLSRLHPECILTPHEGEFARLFPDLARDVAAAGDKATRALRAAARAGCIVVLKGADTVIATPEGFLLINDNAPPDLAVAGSGDVLAGLMVGLLAQTGAPLIAAASAVWLHGAAAARAGPGLIADELPEAARAALGALRRDHDHDQPAASDASDSASGQGWEQEGPGI